jgi:hypothetical protein
VRAAGALGVAGQDAVEAIERGVPMSTVKLDRGEREVQAMREAGTLLPAPAPMDPTVFRRDWQTQLVVPVTAHPAPLVPYRTATEAEIPSAARTVRKAMEAAGWLVRATYALGWAIDSKGATKALTHSTALRAQRGGRRLVAVWIVKEDSEALVRMAAEEITGAVPPPVKGWKFDLAYGWSKVSPLHGLSAAALKAEIQEAPDHG